MLINRDHARWAAGCTAASIAATVAYLVATVRSPAGVTGGSCIGLIFGTIATILMLGVGLLAARKKVRTWRVGSAHAWLKAHIWCGILVVPFVWFHSDFSLGGPLTTTIMVLFYLIIGSGFLGLLLQHIVPTKLTTEVPLETVYTQIDHVMESIAVNAYELVASITGPLEEAVPEQQRIAAERAAASSIRQSWKMSSRVPAATTPAPGAEQLRKVYLESVRPFLWAGSAASPFDALTSLSIATPDELRDRILRLHEMCSEVDQLRRQHRLQRWLHLWLFVHVPISFSFFVFLFVHIVTGLRYALALP